MTLNQRTFNIAIDGPAGAGKSTIAKKVARQLGFVYVDTGAMYRAMAVYLTRQGLEPGQARLEDRIRELCWGTDISIVYQSGEQVVILNGENVNPYLRTETVSAMASVSSAVPEVRVRLVALQQKLAAEQNVVMDGRDIGTVVLPEAQVKVYLTASVGVRARRRYKENVLAVKNGAQKSADDLNLEKIRADIADRDHRDMTRGTSPLKQADDAVLIDSSDMTIDAVAETILNLAAAALGRPRVITAASAGFCFGVEHAVDTVYREIAKRDKAGSDSPINTYGPIIHNETVVEELRSKGVGIINTVEEAQAQKGGTVIIRSHGVSKETYDGLCAGSAEVVDTTCTYVKRIHDIVHRAGAEGKHVVIIGNHGHAETEGTVGWCVTPADSLCGKAAGTPENPEKQPENGGSGPGGRRPAVTVIETEEEARNFTCDPDTPVCVVAQTTFNAAKFEKFVALLRANGYNIEANETICSATDERQGQARAIAKIADVMIVIGGLGSSNTARLYEICRQECARTYFIQTVEDLDLQLTGSEKVIGITAGASTPKKIIEEVQSNVRRTDF